MKAICNREKLLGSFQTAATIAPARSPKPILQNIKLEVFPERAILMATDMELGIRIEVADVKSSIPGAAILPVSRVGSLLRENQDETLEIEADHQRIVIKGQRSEFKLPAYNPDEFPNVQEFSEEKHHQIAARLLKELIRRTLFATDTESSRYALGGVLLEFEADRIIAVGTDGRRLAKMEGPAASFGGHETSDSMTIVPAKSMQLIDRAIAEGDGEICIAARPNDIMIKSPRATIYSRLVDGRFPKWRDVIPDRKQGRVIELSVGPTLSALRQAAIVTSEESRGIDFAFDAGSLVLSGQTADVGQSRVELPIAYEGGRVVMALDHRFVGDFLKVLDVDKTFSLNVSDADSAALCTTDDGYNYVLMPLARDRAAKSA